MSTTVTMVRDCVETLRQNNYIYTDEDRKIYTGDRAIAKLLNLSVGQTRALLKLIYKQEV